MNPLLLTLIPFSVVFAISNDLDKNGILFSILLFTVTGFCIRPLSVSEKTGCGNTTELSLFYRLLPIERHLILKSLFITMLIYSMTLYLIFGVLLTRSFTLPALNDLIINYDPESHISLLSGTYIGPRGFVHQHSEIHFPSLIFGFLKNESSRYIFPGARILLPLFGAAATLFVLLWRIFKPVHRKHLTFTALTTFISGTLLLILFLGDLFLPSYKVGEIRTILETIHGPFLISLLFLITLFWLIIGSISIMNSELQETAHV